MFDENWANSSARRSSNEALQASNVGTDDETDFDAMTYIFPGGYMNENWVDVLGGAESCAICQDTEVKPFQAQQVTIIQPPIERIIYEKAWRGFSAFVRFHHRAETFSYPCIARF